MDHRAQRRRRRSGLHPDSPPHDPGTRTGRQSATGLTISNSAGPVGQLGATTPTRQHTDTRAGTELSWLDTLKGRIQVTTYPTNGGWLSINPLRPDHLRTAITELVELIRTAHTG
ncbi:ESX secretion-associated protein EspG [Actinophytocola sp.]|uniref:ESX secretion-associated protein EspG n=1 Tax=Actinophytocola sp. TaxID=1872138 RepID=UPI0039C875CF